MREFPPIWYKHFLGLKDEQIRFWWSDVLHTLINRAVHLHSMSRCVALIHIWCCSEYLAQQDDVCVFVTQLYGSEKFWCKPKISCCCCVTLKAFHCSLSVVCGNSTFPTCNQRSEAFYLTVPSWKTICAVAAQRESWFSFDQLSPHKHLCSALLDIHAPQRMKPQWLNHQHQLKVFSRTRPWKEKHLSQSHQTTKLRWKQSQNNNVIFSHDRVDQLADQIMWSELVLVSWTTEGLKDWRTEGEAAEVKP